MPGRCPAADGEASIASALSLAPHGYNNPSRFSDPSGHLGKDNVVCTDDGYCGNDYPVQYQIPPFHPTPTNTTDQFEVYDTGDSDLDLSLALGSEKDIEYLPVNPTSFTIGEDEQPNPNIVASPTQFSPNYGEVIAGATLLFITEALGIVFSIAAGIGSAAAGPEVAIPAAFFVFVVYHEITAPIFAIGFYLIYDGLNPKEK